MLTTTRRLIISALVLGILVVFAVTLFIVRTRATANAAESVVQSRDMFAACERDSTAQIAAIKGLTPIGVAYFVGFTCSGARESYVTSLRAANTTDVSAIMSKIDMDATRYAVSIAKTHTK